MYQAWIQFKNNDVVETQSVDFPYTQINHADGNEETKLEVKDFQVPSWDNVICTLRYNDENPKRSTRQDSEEEAKLPTDDVLFRETCGFQLLSMYDTGTWEKVGTGPQDSEGQKECKNWTLDPAKTGFLGDDKIEILCNFKRPFKAEEQ